MSTNSEELEQTLRKREDERVVRNETIRQQWMTSENRRRALESSFPAFEGRVRQIFSSSGSDGADKQRRLYILPMSAAQLARQSEETAEFENLVADICGLEAPDFDYDPDAVSPSWVSAEFLPDLLWRSGFYQAVISNQPTEALQELVIDRAPVLERDVVYLRPLEGCHFARDRFDLCGFSIVRLSATEVEALGERSVERGIVLRLTKPWVLRELVRSRSGCVDISLTGPTGDLSDQGSKLSAKRAAPARITLDNYLFPLLALTLYSDERFEIPSVLLSEPGWRLLTLVSSPSTAADRLHSGSSFLAAIRNLRQNV